MAKYWRYSYYRGRPIILKIDGNSGQTTYALAHLKNKHNINCKADDSIIPFIIVFFSVVASAGALITVIITTKAVREAYGFITQFNATKFRQTLIIFIIMCNIAFSVIESRYF
jgi:ABC-type uncharacterized transport system fused permease/ATPase subunit